MVYLTGKTRFGFVMSMKNNYMLAIFLFVLALPGKLLCEEYMDADTVLPVCTFSMTEQYFERWGFSIHSFGETYYYINSSFCKIDTSSFKDQVFRILTEENIDSTYSRKIAAKFNAAWVLSLDDDVWCKKVEEFAEKQMKLARQKKKYERYYWLAQILIRKSAKWFYYAMEVYNTDVEIRDRYTVFEEIIRRFKNSTNPAELMKVESILYAVLSKGTYFIPKFDGYLQEKSEKYRNSKQRLRIVKVFYSKYDIYREHSGFKYAFEYCAKVEEYLKGLKHLSNYDPPLTIE